MYRKHLIVKMGLIEQEYRAAALAVSDLLQQCAARQHVPYDHLANAHRVREYRNTLLHGGSVPAVPLAQARSWLCTFAGWMPPQW